MAVTSSPTLPPTLAIWIYTSRRGGFRLAASGTIGTSQRPTAAWQSIVEVIPARDEVEDDRD